jgi:hypothetical protein
MPVRERVSSFNQSSTCLSGSKYRAWVTPFYTCPGGCIIPQSVHYMPVLKAYHLSVSPQYTSLGARTDLRSVHYMPVRKRGSSLSQYNTSVWECILSLSHSTIYPWSQSTIHLSGSAYHPSVSSLYVCLRGRTILEVIYCMSIFILLCHFRFK